MSDPSMAQGLSVPPTTNWHIRRLFLFGTTLFYMGIIVYILVTDKQGQVAETAVMFSLMGIMSNVLGYVFGAISETKALMKKATTKTNTTLKI